MRRSTPFLVRFFGPSVSSRFTFQVRVAHVVLGSPARVLTFVLSLSMHALGHAAVALLAGVLARALVGGDLPGAGRSSGRSFVSPGEVDAFSLAWLALAAMVVKVGGQIGAVYLQARASGDLGAWMRMRVLDAWLGVHRLLSPGQQGHGRDDVAALAALTLRVRDLETGVAGGVLGGARAIAQLVPLAAVAFVLSPRLTVVAALVLVPFAVTLGRLRRRWKAAAEVHARGGAAILGAADEAVRHADLWATFGARARVREHLRALGATMARHGARTEAIGAVISGSNEILGALALVATILAARAGWLGGEGASADVLPFVVTFFLAYRPLRELTDARLALARARLAMDAFERLGAAREGGGDDAIAAEEAGESRGEARARAFRLAALEIDGLECARGAAGPLSFVAPPGSVVAIVGPTGVGKTTLIRTLLGLEPPKAGRVLYDGRPIAAEAPPGPGSRPFAWVPQDSPLLLDTLEANVRLAPDAGPAEPVLRSLGAGHLVASTRGARLGGERPVSGGERQWIALARALATRAPVLLLDEPTSGLDPVAQEEVLAAVARLRGERTVLLVTHRAEPLSIADRVVRLGGDAAPLEGGALTAA